jgi:hypothetical protein
MTDPFGGRDLLGNKSGRSGSLLGNGGEVLGCSKVDSAVDTVLRTQIKRRFFNLFNQIIQCLVA